jgi:hypothetical protein
MKKNFIDMIRSRIEEAKIEGFSGVEIEIFIRIQEINQELLNDLAAEGNDVIYVEESDDIFPKLLISWD